MILTSLLCFRINFFESSFLNILLVCVFQVWNMAKVKVHVVYCGGWGYRPKFERLKAQLGDEFGDEIECTGEGTPDVSGKLEVTVNGTLVHSKKNGDGYVDSDAKLKKIVSAIEAALK